MTKSRYQCTLTFCADLITKWAKCYCSLMIIDFIKITKENEYNVMKENEENRATYETVLSK